MRVREWGRGKEEETDGKQPLRAKNLGSDKCLLYTVLIRGSKADGTHKQHRLVPALRPQCKVQRRATSQQGRP